MVPNTPYSHHLDGRDPLIVMRETIPAISNAVGGSMTSSRVVRSVALRSSVLTLRA